jgi:hypothetical protein
VEYSSIYGVEVAIVYKEVEMATKVVLVVEEGLHLDIIHALEELFYHLLSELGAELRHITPLRYHLEEGLLMQGGFQDSF